MRNKTIRSRVVGSLLSVSFLVASCTSLQNHPALEALQGIKPQSPFVEGSFEFGGPNRKWAGPVSFVLTVNARDPGLAKVRTQPEVRAWSPTEDPQILNRVPAAAVPRTQLSADDARAGLSEIGSQMTSDSRTFGGCLYPVRARLVRLDGSILEKQGCRSPAGWPNSVSRAVVLFLE